MYADEAGLDFVSGAVMVRCKGWLGVMTLFVLLACMAGCLALDSVIEREPATIIPDAPTENGTPLIVIALEPEASVYEPSTTYFVGKAVGEANAADTVNIWLLSLNDTTDGRGSAGTVTELKPICTIPDEAADTGMPLIVTAEPPMVIVRVPSITYAPDDPDTGITVCV